MISHPCVWKKVNQGRERRSLHFSGDAAWRVPELLSRRPREDLLYPEEQQDPGNCHGALGSSSDALYGAVMATRWEPSPNPLNRAISLCPDSFKLNSLPPALNVIFKYLTIRLNMMIVLIKRLKLEGFTLNPGLEVVKNRF